MSKAEELAKQLKEAAADPMWMSNCLVSKQTCNSAAAHLLAMEGALQEAGDLAASSQTGPAKEGSLRTIEEITVKAIEHRDGRLSALERAVKAESEVMKLRALDASHQRLKEALGNCVAGYEADDIDDDGFGPAHEIHAARAALEQAKDLE